MNPTKQLNLQDSQRGISSLRDLTSTFKSHEKSVPRLSIKKDSKKFNMAFKKKTGFVPLSSQTNTDRWFNKDKLSETSRKCQNIFRSVNFNRKGIASENGEFNSYSKRDLDVLINQTCKYEDSRLDEILNNIIESKKNDKLPKLSLSHRKIDCSSINKYKGLTKYMGENYDPYNYLVTITKPTNCILLKKFGKS
jgi:hypothetical protein